MSLGFLFIVCNGYLNGRYLFSLSPACPASWLKDPGFLVGLSPFISGSLINRQADRILRHLRPQGEAGYKISQSGLYRWISCPNYLGEIVEWTGWAVATWSLPGLAFALWTAANLIPRAWPHLLWHREHFPENPRGTQSLGARGLVGLFSRTCNERTAVALIYKPPFILSIRRLLDIV